MATLSSGQSSRTPEPDQDVDTGEDLEEKVIMLGR
jgi:hypothetical protein